MKTGKSRLGTKKGGELRHINKLTILMVVAGLVALMSFGRGLASGDTTVVVSPVDM